MYAFKIDVRIVTIYVKFDFTSKKWYNKFVDFNFFLKCTNDIKLYMCIFLKTIAEGRRFMRRKLTTTMMLMAMVMLLLAGCGKEKNAEDNTSSVNTEQTTSQETEKSKDTAEAEDDKNSIIITFGRVGEDEDTESSEEAQSDTYRYYYNQLTDKEKGMYDAILSGKEDLIDNQPVTVISFDSNDEIDYSAIGGEVSKAYTACLMDNPEISMWLKKFACSMKAEAVLDEKLQYAGMVYNIQIEVAEGETSYSDFSSPDETRQAVLEVETRTKEFVKTLEGLSDEEKATEIHNWILEDASYDESVSLPNIRSVYGAIVQKECVCAGFAYAFKYASNIAGIDTLVITGTGVTPTSPEGGPHAWNNVCLNGTWSLVDLTWDCEGTAIYEEEEDEYIEDGMYVISKTYTFVGTTYGNEYLFKPLSETVQTHVASEEFEVPNS